MKLYNTTSRTIEDFVPNTPGVVNLYTCGPTVYNFAHIGNLRTYIHEDILEKSLEYLGFSVNRVMNITDVGHLESDADDGEDKMLKGAQRENKTVWEVAEFYTEAFKRDCEKLNIRWPEVVAKATDYIEAYIDFIQALESKGYTYFAGGNVYFDISKFPNYTKLSGMNLEDLKVALRADVEQDVHKKNPQDFVLWFTKSKFENQAMKWESPWGVGYPGWHIECSVISLKNLGPKLDIHCGGVDHVAIHHTNEIAQTESYTGEAWTKYWWHAEFLIESEGKMSKSSGEFLTVSLLEQKGFDPRAYRYFVLNSHYRKQLTFSFESLEMAQAAYEKLLRRTRAAVANGYGPGVLEAMGDETLAIHMEALSDDAKAFLAQFKTCLADDLNTANAITVVYDLLKAALDAKEKHLLLASFERVLSLDLVKVADKAVDGALEEWVLEQLEVRRVAKAAKDWAKADAIRDALKARGIAIKDTPQGTSWTLEN